MQAFEPDKEKKRDEPSPDAAKREIGKNEPKDSSATDPLKGSPLPALDPGHPRVETEDQRRKRQWALNDRIKEHFVLAPGDSAEHFLQVFDPDNLHAFLHSELGRNKQNPIHAGYVADSQREFLNHLAKNVQIFLDGDPTFDQIARFLRIPNGLKLTPETLREYHGVSALGDEPHYMTDYYWNKAASFVYDFVIPRVGKVEELIALVNVECPEVEGLDFVQPTRGAMYDAVIRGFTVSGEDLGWMHRLKGFDGAINSNNVESPLVLLKDLILDTAPEEHCAAGQTANVVKALCGNYLQHRLLSGTNGGETTHVQLDAFMRQPTLKESPDDSIQRELAYQRSFLFKYLLGRQTAGYPLAAPAGETDRVKLQDVAEKSGYTVRFKDDKFCVERHSIDAYGESLRTIASNLRKRLRECAYENSAQFVSHFDPARLPKVEEVPHLEYTEPTPKKRREWQLRELVGVVFFEELARQMPRFHPLNPSAREVRALLELQLHVPFDIRYNADACNAHDAVMSDLFDRYLGKAKTIQDWTTVVTYRTLPAAEFEGQQQSAYNAYFWKAVELGDPALQWMAYDVWGNRMTHNKFNEANTVRAAFEDLEETERNDTAMIQRAVSLIQGTFLREQAKETIADDPTNQLRVALISAISGIPIGEFDPKHVDPEDLDRVEKHQKRVMANYLVARQAAGATIPVPDGMLAGFSKNVDSLGFRVELGSESAQPGERLVRLHKKVPSAAARAVSVVREFFKTAAFAPFKQIAKENRIRKRGWR